MRSRLTQLFRPGKAGRAVFAAALAVTMLAMSLAACEGGEAEEPEGQMPAAVLSLSGLEPAELWHTMETPNTVSADAMGDILCDETLPDGTEIICYWAPGTEYTKYWAIRHGEDLLRFCEEESSYREDYRVEPFSNVLGHDGFRILCPRGASYSADDYYYLDGDGVPCLLAGCSGSVLERDVDNDGRRELLWLSGGAIPSVYYVFQREGVTYQVDISQWLRDSLGAAWLPLPDWEQWEDGTCAISLLNWEEKDPAHVPAQAAEGYVVFTKEDIRLFLYGGDTSGFGTADFGAGTKGYTYVQGRDDPVQVVSTDREEFYAALDGEDAKPYAVWYGSATGEVADPRTPESEPADDPAARPRRR